MLSFSSMLFALLVFAISANLLKFSSAWSLYRCIFSAFAWKAMLMRVCWKLRSCLSFTRGIWKWDYVYMNMRIILHRLKFTQVKWNMLHVCLEAPFYTWVGVTIPLAEVVHSIFVFVWNKICTDTQMSLGLGLEEEDNGKLVFLVRAEMVFYGREGSISTHISLKKYNAHLIKKI